ncbi:MAG: hypothetical protein A3K06_02850 [Candidatus Doudnabacteria bacterium RIFCSPHIGHO2_01_52_17]|uniref:Uncharacterized protein n=1 Tax=Candidatus Doudnabacteria bacterium RIFCSPHIGHO2_01_52_17 TaxID=1817820 RepID=A0A1F5N8Y5_9BACT|nr:MAG: hypothetical protein A3K06_02850 [Candidatus Doudnabacteria bacterium RIFCSPHIGHO2_01_52_17]
MIFSRRRADERHIAAFRPRVGARSGISKDFFVPVISPEKSYVKSDLLRRFVSGHITVYERRTILVVSVDHARLMLFNDELSSPDTRLALGGVFPRHLRSPFLRTIGALLPRGSSFAANLLAECSVLLA